MEVWCLRATALVAALSAVGCDVKVGKDGDVSVDVARGTATDEWTRTYVIKPGGRIEITNVDGTILLTAAVDDTVAVTATRDVRAGSVEVAREMLAKVEMIEDVAADRVRVEAKPGPRPGGLLGLESRVRVNFRVAVPRGIAAHVRTENGGVRLEDVTGEIVAESTNGQITGRGVAGSLKATTVNGGAQIELASLNGNVEILTVNGQIRVELPPDIDALLEARAVNGGVLVAEGLPLVATERTRTHVAGRLNDGGPRISLQTTNGGVMVGLKGSRFERGQRRGGPDAPLPPLPPPSPDRR